MQATAQYIPVPEPTSLLLDNETQVHGSRKQDHRNDHKADRDLITDHLSSRAQTAQERIFRVRSPTAHDDAVNAER